MESKKISIDFVNGGEPFQIPAMHEDMSVSLYVDLLRIQLETKNEFKACAVREPKKDQKTGNYEDDLSDYQTYLTIVVQRTNFLWLTRILQTIDQKITLEMVDKKGARWVNQTLKKIYAEAPDLRTDFLEAAPGEINSSQSKSNTETSKDTSSVLPSSPDTQSNK